MTYIINESKRDDLLIPYLEKIQTKNPEITLGQFKGMMLDKLAAQGGMNNLSLSSNYYLAGATRYYFNGDLTLDHKVHFGAAKDKWNVDVCRRLNALIMILRDAYIDTIGTSFEQPEDFGTLSLAKLLRKYNKKINAALGIESEPQKVKNAPVLNEDPNVGNGYTFDILYSYEDATKYNQYTTPGAWCITYAQHHYNYYVKNLGIHYVIFLKNGFEEVKRPPMPVSKRKPHDEYGNSMIAFLQSNKDPHGVYITSRWNHGYGESSGTEADHAYTNEEFMQITGVSAEDLKRIFEIWKTNAPKQTNTDKSRADSIRIKKELVHKMKYAQMRINGGEDPTNFFLFTKLLYGKVENGPRKTVCVARPKSSYFGDEWQQDYRPYFIIDKGTILFDSMIWGRDGWPEADRAEAFYHCGENDKAKVFRDCILMSDGTGTIFYDMRRKQPIAIDGISKFKYVPDRWAINNSEIDFALVKITTTSMALIDMKTNQPLKLPNGQCWFNDLIDTERYSHRKNTDCYFLNSQTNPILELIYDLSSGEKYFLNTASRKWLTPPSAEEALGISSTNAVPCLVNGLTLGNNVLVPISYENPNRRGWGESIGYIILNNDFKETAIGHFSKYRTISENNNMLAFSPLGSQMPNEDELFISKPGSLALNNYLAYDITNNMVLKVDGKYLLIGGVRGYGSISYILDDYGYVALYLCGPGNNGNGSRHEYFYIYDPKRKALLMNPFKYPSPLLFDYSEYSSGYEMREYNALAKDEKWSYTKKKNRCLVIYKDGGYNPSDEEPYRWDADYFNSSTMRKHLVPICPNTLSAYPVDLQNIESIHLVGEQQQQPLPAMQIRENDIRDIVKNALNEVYGRRK